MKTLYFIENSGNPLFGENASWEIDQETAINLLSAGIVVEDRLEHNNFVSIHVYRRKP